MHVLWDFPGNWGYLSVTSMASQVSPPFVLSLAAPLSPMPTRRTTIALLLGTVLPLPAGETVVSSLALEELDRADTWPAPLRELIRYALSLTQRKLGYQFGSSDPDEGGMDCSGTIHHLLKHHKIAEPPRQADDFYQWVKAAGGLNPVRGSPALGDPVLAKLKPGDLLFWTGTYKTGDRALPISHVMFYLGKTKTGKPVMFGASDGRPYQGKRQNGVSVFDFRIPAAESQSKFVGYGPIPGLDTRKVPAAPPG